MNNILPSHFDANGKEVSGKIKNTSIVVEVNKQDYSFVFTGDRFIITKIIEKEGYYKMVDFKDCSIEEIERVKMFVFNMWQIHFAKMTKVG